jgi:hypothetical protein
MPARGRRRRGRAGDEEDGAGPGGTGVRLATGTIAVASGPGRRWERWRRPRRRTVAVGSCWGQAGDGADGTGPGGRRGTGQTAPGPGWRQGNGGRV